MNRTCSFFKVFYDKMSEAQSEIKSTVTVNTTDIATRAHDDKDALAAKDIERVVKKRACEYQTKSNFELCIASLRLIFFEQ